MSLAHKLLGTRRRSSNGLQAVKVIRGSQREWSCSRMWFDEREGPADPVAELVWHLSGRDTFATRVAGS